MAEYRDYVNNTAEKQKAYAAKTMSKEEFENAYGEVTDEQFNEYVRIGNTLTEKPTFKPEDTALGELMIQNGVLEGMS
jgi:hypothetical protein